MQTVLTYFSNNMNSECDTLTVQKQMLALVRVQETLKEALKREQKRLLRVSQDNYFLAERVLQKKDPSLSAALHEVQSREEPLLIDEPQQKQQKRRRKRKNKDEQEPRSRRKRKQQNRPAENPSDMPTEGQLEVCFSSGFRSLQPIRRPYQMANSRQPKRVQKEDKELKLLNECVVRAAPHSHSLLEDEGDDDGDDEDDDTDEDNFLTIQEDGDELEDDGLDIEEELLGGDDEDLEDDIL